MLMLLYDSPTRNGQTSSFAIIRRECNPSKGGGGGRVEVKSEKKKKEGEERKKRNERWLIPWATACWWWCTSLCLPQARETKREGGEILDGILTFSPLLCGGGGGGRRRGTWTKVWKIRKYAESKSGTSLQVEMEFPVTAWRIYGILCVMHDQISHGWNSTILVEINFLPFLPLPPSPPPPPGVCTCVYVCVLWKKFGWKKAGRRNNYSTFVISLFGGEKRRRRKGNLKERRRGDNSMVPS